MPISAMRVGSSVFLLPDVGSTRPGLETGRGQCSLEERFLGFASEVTAKNHMPNA
jgi:hypothetical protein